jgi:hypothetical protein
MNEKTKEMLANLSPVYGIATGRGMFGKMADKGLLGLGARALADSGQRRTEEKAMQEKLMQQGLASQKAETSAAAQPAARMKKGGSVCAASRRADGIAQRGKTKGRIV